MEVEDEETVLFLPKQDQEQTGTDHELLISNTGVKLKSNKRIVVPKYNVNNVPNGLKIHIKYRFALLNLSDQEPELQTDTRNIVWKECTKIMLKVERKEKKDA